MSNNNSNDGRVYGQGWPNIGNTGTSYGAAAFASDVDGRVYVERRPTATQYGYSNDSRPSDVPVRRNTSDRGTSQYPYMDATGPAGGLVPRFDGRGTVQPASRSFWNSGGAPYTDPQSYGSVVGDLPSLGQYAEVGRMVNADQLPRRVPQEPRPQQLDNASWQQQQQQQRRRRRQQEAASEQMRMFLDDKSDYQHVRRSHPGRYE